jgi:ribosomal protein L32
MVVEYKTDDLKLIDYFQRMPNTPTGNKYEQFLRQIPTEQKRYKCFTCFTILNQPDLVDGRKCPKCGEVHLTEMCSLDHNGCRHTFHETLAYCPICGKAICPECGDHNVLQISRVTGYLQDVSGWNSSKQQELKDRTRYTINGEIAVSPIKTIKMQH